MSKKREVNIICRLKKPHPDIDKIGISVNSDGKIVRQFVLLTSLGKKKYDSKKKKDELKKKK
jgi:hypothetical protein